jgi:peptide/nickel transport system substrate-binding protein
MVYRRLAVFTLALLVVAAPPAVAQTKADTLVYAIQSDLPNWDPPNSVLRESIILGSHVFDHLAARDLKTGKVAPALAVSWKTLDDTTWEVKLRKGVKFHDGTPFGARDVKASFDRVLDEKNKLTARGNHTKIKSVAVVDDLTVRFKTDGPYPLFVERLTVLVMQSEKAIKEKGHEWMQEQRAAAARTPSRTSACGRPPTSRPTWTRSSSTCSTASATAWQRPSTPWRSVSTLHDTPLRH